MSQPRRMKRAAYHEAGHAVACHVMGLMFDRAFIGEQGENLAGVTFLRHKEVRPMQQIVVFLAGPIAEARYRRVPVALTIEVEQIFGDTKKARYWADQFAPQAGQTADALFRFGTTYAAKLVRKHWPAIELTAAALVTRNLTYFDFVCVVHGPPPSATTPPIILPAAPPPLPKTTAELMAQRRQRNGQAASP